MIVAEPASFRRIVLGLHPGGFDRRMVRAVAELARQLRLEILAIFIEDQAVFGLTALPFARELRLPGHAWHPLDAERVAADLRDAAEQAQSMLYRESTTLGVSCRFEVRRGDPAKLAASLGEITDILVVAEPLAAADRLTTAATRTRQAAIASRAAVLFLPPSAASREVGPIAVLASGASDPALPLASRIAETTHEKLLILAPRKAAFRALTPSPARDVLKLDTISVAALRRALDGRGERLLIMTRGATGLSDEAPAALASQRGVPVLVLEGRTKAELRPATPG